MYMVRLSVWNRIPFANVTDYENILPILYKKKQKFQKSCKAKFPTLG